MIAIMGRMRGTSPRSTPIDHVRAQRRQAERRDRLYRLADPQRENDRYVGRQQQLPR
ncbi:hypothetical protein [Sphingomonas sp. MMS24-J13]|uniref:hypothetical protein n=1 Tax=Sphingomonas sp. MMS24-J13 TaxID=3238686 RepID=UPI003850C20D